MYCRLVSDIGIGSFRFSGVHEVRVDRNARSVEDYARITVPTKARVLKDGVVTEHGSADLFKEGAAVSIKLGYAVQGGEEEMVEEFAGFVKRTGTGIPLVVECEGYSYQLRNVSVTKDYRKTGTTAKELLKDVCKGTDIVVDCPVDFELRGIKLVKANGLQVCQLLKEASDGALSIFFIEPKRLWCGLTYTAYAAGAVNMWGFPTVDLRVGYNCIRDNGLRKRVNDRPVQVIFKGKYATGRLLYSKSKEKAAKSRYTHLSSQAGNDEVMGKFAQEKAYLLNYSGYDGGLSCFLQPYAGVGWDAHIVNKDYPELDGKYFVEGVRVTFGVGGARRVLSVGPRVGFDKT